MSKELDTFSIVLSGGGMKCVWSAGFLVALVDMGLLPSTIITKSGNAGNAVYLATNQSESIKRIWTEHLTGNRFINWWRFWKVIDIDFLVDDVLTKKEPVNFVALKASPIKVLIACFNVTKQRIDYFSNETITFSVLKATKAMPIVYGKEIRINNDMYTDKPFSPYQLLEDQKHNLEQKILLIDVRDNNVLFRKLYTIVGDKTNTQEISSQNIFVIKPEHIELHLLSSSKVVMEKAYNEGYSFALSKKESIIEFLQKESN